MYVLYSKGTKSRYWCVCVCVRARACAGARFIYPNISHGSFANRYLWLNTWKPVCVDSRSKWQVVCYISLRLMPGRYLKLGQCEKVQDRMKYYWKNLFEGLFSTLVITECFTLRELWTWSAHVSSSLSAQVWPHRPPPAICWSPPSSQLRSEHSFSTLALAVYFPSSFSSSSLMCA